MSKSDPKRLLVVDDDEVVLDLICDYLSSEGYACTRCTTGEKAMAHLAAEPFDAILTDMRMPGMDGMGVLKRAHEIVPGIPVILITVDGTPRAVILAMRLGAAEYLVKPFSFPELVSTVEHVLRFAPSA